MLKQTFVLRVFQAIKKKFSIIFLITAIFTILGGVFSFLLNEELYESTVTFTFGVETTRDTEQVNAVTGEPIKERYIQFGTYSVYNESFQFFTELLRSDDLLSEVNSNLNIGLTNKELEDSISLINPTGSGILKLSVRMADNENVDEVANEVASIFQRRNFEVTELDNLKIINSADESKIINTINIKQIIIISIILGFLVGTVLVIILDYFNTTSKKKSKKD